MKVIIAGTRTFDDYQIVENVIPLCLSSWGIAAEDVEIVSGGAKGADKLGERWAKDNGAIVKIFQADWKNLGRAAGPIRNSQMAEYADVLIAFWDGKSRGTKNMIEQMQSQGKAVKIFEYTI